MSTFWSELWNKGSKCHVILGKWRCWGNKAQKIKRASVCWTMIKVTPENNHKLEGSFGDRMRIVKYSTESHSTPLHSNATPVKSLRERRKHPTRHTFDTSTGNDTSTAVRALVLHSLITIMITIMLLTFFLMSHHIHLTLYSSNTITLLSLSIRSIR